MKFTPGQAAKMAREMGEHPGKAARKARLESVRKSVRTNRNLTMPEAMHEEEEADTEEALGKQFQGTEKKAARSGDYAMAEHSRKMSERMRQAAAARRSSTRHPKP
jgi:hypothetical protein